MQIDFDPLAVSPTDLEDPPTQAYDYMQKTPWGSIFTGYSFYRWLDKVPNSYLWVMTYTYKRNNTLITPVKRLIYSVGETSAKGKQLLGIHTKLYIQFSGDKIIGTYLGSQNLVKPTNANLMIKVPTKHHKFFKEYFQYFWSQA